MIGEIVTVAASLACLALGVGVFGLPDFQRALLCFAGFSAACASFLLAADSDLTGWFLLLGAVSICTLVAGSTRETVRSGWQNWFVGAVAVCSLWLLSLFLLLTLEEALLLPIQSGQLPSSPGETLHLLFTRYTWPLALVGLLALCCGIGALRGEE